MITTTLSDEIFNRIQTLRFNCNLDFPQIVEYINNHYTDLTLEEAKEEVEKAFDLVSSED